MSTSSASTFDWSKRKDWATSNSVAAVSSEGSDSYSSLKIVKEAEIRCVFNDI